MTSSSATTTEEGWLHFIDKRGGIERKRIVKNEPKTGRLLPNEREPTHPGEFLREFLDEMKITQRDLAANLSTTAASVNLIVKGKRGVSARMAWLLAKRFKMSPDFWLNAQMSWDMWHARESLRAEGLL